jgi:hypothetical protein
MILGIINARKIREVHVSVNSRMDQLLSLRGEASKAAGFEEGRLEPRITDAINKE